MIGPTKRRGAGNAQHVDTAICADADRGLWRRSDRPDRRSTAVLRPRSRPIDQRLHGDDPVGPRDAARSSQRLLYGRKGQLDRAIEDFDQAIRLNPNFAEAYVKRSIAHALKGQPDRAIEDLDQAIRLNPNYAEAFNYRGANYARKFQLDHAIADFDKAIRLNPNFAEAFSNRGNAYRRKGQLDRAIEDLDQAIRLNPNYAQAFYNRGTAYDRKGQFDRAIEDFDQAIRLNPNNVAAFLDRGNEYRAQGDFDRAIADYSEGIRLDPRLTFVLLNRGVAYYYVGSLPKALADLNQASELNPKGAYTALWLDIVNKRSNLASRLQQAVAQIDMTTWPAPVIRLFLGQMTPAAVLAAADDPDPDTKKSHVCDAHFYSGELALRRDAKAEALQLFKAAAESCPRTFIGDVAVAELKRLAQ
jgi:tetratricopeptide (TPR) repeat protein